MGNWHCIPSSCSEVVYQEYEPPKIRWRYPGELWQEIIADDYSIEQSTPGGNSTNYYIKASCKVEFWYWSRAAFFKQGDVFPSIDTRTTSIAIVGPISSLSFESAGRCPNGDPSPDPCTYGGSRVNLVITDSQGVKRVQTLLWTDAPFTGGVISPSNNNFCKKDTFTNQAFEIKRVDNLPDQNCIFKAYLNKKIVYQETRAVCPEVEKIPCKLSTTKKSIKIEKLPYLERIEVVPYQYSTYRSPGIPAPIVQSDPIPRECLNIYNNAIYVIPPSGQGIYPNATPFDSLVTQICSYSGCPPPEYQVICDCESCKSCPENTCAVECDGHICCYDKSGKSIESIALSDYCGGGS